MHQAGVELVQAAEVVVGEVRGHADHGPIEHRGGFVEHRCHPDARVDDEVAVPAADVPDVARMIRCTWGSTSCATLWSCRVRVNQGSATFIAR